MGFGILYENVLFCMRVGTLREARKNIENLYNARKAAIDFFDEYT